jgi:TolB protein
VPLPTASRLGRAVGLLVGAAILCVGCSTPNVRGAPTARRGILYSSQAPGGTEDIRALDPESGASNVIVLGDSLSARSLAAWSPDSRRVAFVKEYGTRSELYVLDSLDGVPRRIGRDLPGAILFPDWSPDGNRLLVSAGEKFDHPGVYLVDAASGVSKLLRSDSSAYRCPSWSPRGDRLVVASYRQGRNALVIVDTLGRALDTIVQSDTTYLDCPQWSPREHEVLFTVFHGGGESGWVRPAFHSNLAIVSLSSRAVVQVTRDRGLTNYGRWARDGEWIVFQSDRHAPPTTSAANAGQMLQNLEIWIIRRDGDGARRLTTNTYFDSHPSW